MTEIQFPSKLPLEVVDVQAVLPHRYPMLLIDRVFALAGGSLESRVGRKIHARKNISINEEVFNGHFPGHPVFPGVLSIEAMAQASALCAYAPEKNTQRFYIAAVQEAKFRTPIIPGDCVDLYSECIKDRGSIVIFNARAEVDAKVVAEAELWAKIF